MELELGKLAAGPWSSPCWGPGTRPVRATASRAASRPGRREGHGDYRDEIDTEISDADEASAHAEETWRVQRQLIA
jgi:hypothetical protein